MSDDTTPPPPLGEGEFIHFEYLHFDPEDAETGFSNMVEISHDRTMAQDKAARLIADPRVWAIHIRRFEQPEQGVHLYDETQHLAKAQNQAYAERKRAETLQQLLGAAVGGACEMDTKHQRTIAHNEITIEAFSAVIEELARTLENIRTLASNAQRDAVFLEPGDIARMAKVNLGALRASEFRKAKERAKLRADGERSEPQRVVKTVPGSQHEHRYESAHTIEDWDVCTVGDCGLPYNSAKLYRELTERHACKKCGRPEMDHSQWALGHLYERGEVRLDYRASVTMRAIPQRTHSEHLFTTSDESGIVPDDACCRMNGCLLSYGAAKQQGLTVTASALSVLPTPASKAEDGEE